ncbi:NAD-dependent epimerase/dehydratase family protein [Clostridium gasigenes]|uniref:GDP-mannose 4,6-dehydratase n=1 Tax=Clostridium gasigenes TaxID=94869 RepID=A0A7X0SE38_9CLOT|nr:NAD-dependent epimerase/dehydratase family protein [Clostridium gasigenes]MBB6714607.1 GDP-mannose 4,6-dehydratase [Clostridium gasigenes]
MKKKYLVTGASGFVGACLVRRLVENNENVHIIARETSDLWRVLDIKENLTIHNVDLMNEEQIKKMTTDEKFNVIYHLATYGGYHFQKNLDNIINTNLIGTWNLFRYASETGVEMFVNTSSSSEYGEKDEPMNEEMILNPNNMYGATKASSTILCSTYAKINKIPFVTYRLFSPYGYYDAQTRLIPTVIDNCLKNKKIELGSKTSKRDFIFIDDVIDAYIKAPLLCDKYGEVYNIGSGIQYTVEEVVNKIVKQTNSNAELVWNNNLGRQYEPKAWYSDISKIKQDLGWSPKLSMDEGLDITINWLKKDSL